MKFEPVRLSDIQPNDGHTYIYFHYEYSDSEICFGEVIEIGGQNIASHPSFYNENESLVEYEVVFKQPRLNKKEMCYEGSEIKIFTLVFYVQKGKSIADYLSDVIFTRIT